jgi:hypothetical protein
MHTDLIVNLMTPQPVGNKNLQVFYLVPSERLSEDWRAGSGARKHMPPSSQRGNFESWAASLLSHVGPALWPPAAPNPSPKKIVRGGLNPRLATKPSTIPRPKFGTCDKLRFRDEKSLIVVENVTKHHVHI